MEKFSIEQERRWSSKFYQFLKTETAKLGIQIWIYKSDGRVMDEGIFYGHAIAVKDGYKIKEGEQTPFFSDLSRTLKTGVKERN